MNNELESILSHYYYGPTDVWDDYVKAVEEWARNERANAWDEGASAAATELDGPEYWLPGEDDFPNPYRK